MSASPDSGGLSRASLRARRLLCGCAAAAFVWVVLAGARASAADPRLLTTADVSLPQESILLPPRNVPLYAADFSRLPPEKQMVIAIHGIRLAALHPLIWEVRRIDRTENRQIVPIRPFYFRASESPEFRLAEIDLRMSFKAAKKAHMLKFPEQKTAVLDIEFGGEYVKGLPGERDDRDSAYVARISASPQLASGIYYRSYDKFVLLVPIEPAQIESGRTYDVALKTDAGQMVLLLDGVEKARLKGEYRRGLISLNVCWHPLTLEQLLIKGGIMREGKSLPFEDSGLVRTK